jgi:hypothetical protein
MTQLHRVTGVATNIRTENGATVVRYHSTDVVQFTPEHIVLNTGGWRTNTTKTRMNQSARQFGLGYNVYQHKLDWFVSFKGQTIPFDSETIVLER